MSNLANIQKLYYCDCGGKNSTCSEVATHQVKLSKKDDSLLIPTKVWWEYRCDEHINKGTKSKRVYETSELDQSYTLQKVNAFLKSLIGKSIKSSMHTAKGLEVKYLKSNGGVMCYQPISKKWKFVYYEQIQSVT